jgi:hypothetical protein
LFGTVGQAGFAGGVTGGSPGASISGAATNSLDDCADKEELTKTAHNITKSTFVRPVFVRIQSILSGEHRLFRSPMLSPLDSGKTIQIESKYAI